MLFKKPLPLILNVKQATYITPNMIRVTFGGSELAGIATGREGGNCKLTLPNSGQNQEQFVQQLRKGEKFPVRTYTVRDFRQDALEMDIDFVAHGDEGPASRWAMSAKPGDFCGFRGPSPAKITNFNGDYYIVAADMSALPLATVTLEAMPRDAKGIAIIEVTSEADKQTINAPEDVNIHWLIHPDPHTASSAQENFLRQLDWPSCRVQVCIAGESNTVKALRQFVLKEKGVKKSDAYISGYWKIGLVEDEHQKMKKSL
jgi:NADPH-dependent ferric siderophore reductase